MLDCTERDSSAFSKKINSDPDPDANPNPNPGSDFKNFNNTILCARGY